jgi:type IV secretory pathway TraG/TraD family ATPase VirD4
MVRNDKLTRFGTWVRTATPEQHVGALMRMAALFDTMRAWPERTVGVPIGKVDGETVCLPIEGHSITVGSSGEGKFTSAIAPLALHDIRDDKNIASGMVFVDPKNGEAARITGPYRRMLREEQVFILDPYNKAGGTDALNPFDFLDATADDFFESCQGLANALVVQRPTEKRGNDFIWDSRGSEWLTAMIAHLALDPTEERTLRRLRSIFACEEDAFAAVLLAMRENPRSPSWVRDMADDMSRVTRKAEREASGYIATIWEATRFVDSAMMSRVLDRSTFDPIVVRSHGATVYIVSHNGYLQQSAPWVRLMCEIVRQRIARSSINRHVHWVIDEARAFDAWSFISDGLRAMRSERISLHLFYQNLGQLKGVWGEGWSSITDVRMIRFLGSNDVETLEWIAKLAGEVSVIDYSQARSESASHSVAAADGTSTSTAIGHTDTRGSSTSESDGKTRGTSKGTSSARGKSTARGQSRSASETRSEGTAHTIGRSRTVTWSNSVTESGGTSSGGSTSKGDSWSPNGGVTFSGSSSHSSSSNHSEAITEGIAIAVGENESHTRNKSVAQGVTRGDSLTETDSTTDTDSQGASESRTNTQTVGSNASASDTKTETEGRSKTRTETEGDTRGRTDTETERRRLLTIDEVRRMSKRSVLVFIDREPDCLIDRLHYHETPPLVARVLAAQLAALPPPATGA